MSYVYKTHGTCSTKIEVELDGNIVKNVKFTGGCHGNLQAVSRLVAGKNRRRSGVHTFRHPLRHEAHFLRRPALQSGAGSLQRAAVGFQQKAQRLYRGNTLFPPVQALFRYALPALEMTRSSGRVIRLPVNIHIRIRRMSQPSHRQSPPRRCPGTQSHSLIPYIDHCVLHPIPSASAIIRLGSQLSGLLQHLGIGFQLAAHQVS